MQEALDGMKKGVEIDPSVAEARRAVPRLQVAAEEAEELKEQMMGQLRSWAAAPRQVWDEPRQLQGREGPVDGVVQH